jgi:hypothetical protein
MELAPTTQKIRETFAEEMSLLGGTVSDAFDDGTRLFLRGVLPVAADVRPGDAIHGGVALRTLGPEILVHPYTFREVCTNGAIRAHALEARRVARAEPAAWGAGDWPAREVLADLRDAVHACAGPDAFREGVDEMRSALEIEADHLLVLGTLMSRMGPEHASAFARQILRQFETRPDPHRSLFGLMNAVTAVARDTRDPETRWRLEELGGAVPLMRPRRPKPLRGAVRLETLEV